MQATNIPEPLDASTLARLASFLAAHWQTPEDYIVRQFARRDVVLLAEEHRIRHNLLLARALIPRLYQAGADWDEVQRQWPDPHWHRRPRTLADYWAYVRAYDDVPARYAPLSRA